MTDATEYMERMLRIGEPLVAPLRRAVVAALDLPHASHGLDAGCGVGLQIPLLAEAVGPEGHVTGLDVLPEFLTHAEALVERLALKERVSLRQGDINDLPFEDNTFDWVWSADCAGDPAGQPFAQLRELSRVVKPGGKVALLMSTFQALLPGHPLLEARLNATSTGIAPFTAGLPPENHWLRAIGWFRAAGLKQVKAQTFVRDVQAPLSKELRAAVAAWIEMRWGGAEPEVEMETWREYERLGSADSPDFIGDVPDYYGLIAATLIRGEVVPEAE
jgi:ubiquinone/menaquinone biosynthesis C-methylase UbiE